MAYAVVADVTARAGRLAGAFTVAGKHPDANDITGFLADLSADIDSTIRGHGYDPASMSASAVAALKDIVAYGALARALAGIPGGASSSVKAALTEARLIWDTALLSITAGTHTVIRQLEAGQAAGGTGPSAGAMWTEEPNYGKNETPVERMELNPDWAPRFARTQKF